MPTPTGFEPENSAIPAITFTVENTLYGIGVYTGGGEEDVFRLTKLRASDGVWIKTESYLRAAEVAYTAIGSAGALALRFVISPCRDRFNEGERTQKLYDDIHDIAL